MSSQLLFPLPVNRVRRNYRGGAMLAAWDGVGEPVDGECPEDWIASTVPARNPGLSPIVDEGLSTVDTPVGPQRLTDAIEADPQGILGQRHVEQNGLELGFLTKLLDAGMRLHIQAHPTAEFAQKHLGSRWGKLEAYLILGTRDGCDGSLFLGFQNCPSPSEWKRIVMEQDKQAMLACFERVPVQPGELWLVPGGVPHAIGEGLLVVEIMEPSDLVVRCEFEHEGILLPPEGRFMGRDPDFAMQIFQYAQWSVEEVRRRFCIQPCVLTEAPGVVHERLFGPEQNKCFEVQRVRLESEASFSYPPAGRVAVVLVTSGSGAAAVGTQAVDLKQGSRFLVAAAADAAHFAAGPNGLEAVVCQPQLD